MQPSSNTLAAAVSTLLELFSRTILEALFQKAYTAVFHVVLIYDTIAALLILLASMSWFDHEPSASSMSFQQALIAPHSFKVESRHGALQY